MTPSSAPPPTEAEMLSQISDDQATTNEASAHPRPPPPVPFFDASSQVGTASGVHGKPPPVPATPALGTETNIGAPKPKTAEEKRRAAHARRMKLAFGDVTGGRSNVSA